MLSIDPRYPSYLRSRGAAYLGVESHFCHFELFQQFPFLHLFTVFNTVLYFTLIFTKILLCDPLIDYNARVSIDAASRNVTLIACLATTCYFCKNSFSGGPFSNKCTHTFISFDIISAAPSLPNYTDVS